MHYKKFVTLNQSKHEIWLYRANQKKTDQELTEIFINANDYNPDFLRLAEQELSIRNINLDASKQIREELKQVDKNQLKEGLQTHHQALRCRLLGHKVWFPDRSCANQRYQTEKEKPEESQRSFCCSFVFYGKVLK